MSGICAGDGQQVVHQTSKAVHFLQHAADRIPVVLGIALFLKADLAYGADRGQRRAQLMRGIRGKTPELLKRPFQPR